MPRKPGPMGKKGDKTLKRTDRELADEELQVLLVTDIDWEKLRPQIKDKTAYDNLIGAVEEANRKNKDIALLKTRLQALGKESWTLAKKVIETLP
jgi:hypothetical protein